MMALWIFGGLFAINAGVIAVLLLRGRAEGVKTKMPVGVHRHWDED